MTGAVLRLPRIGEMAEELFRKNVDYLQDWRQPGAAIDFAERLVTNESPDGPD